MSLACALALVMVFSLMVLWLPNITQDVSAYSPHAPIAITGDAGFSNASGVVSGSGTLADPYIIRGWEISSASNTGISIADTNAHFVISGVYVHGTGSSDGISLANVINSRIEDSIVSANYQGVLIDGSSMIQLCNCTIVANINCGLYCHDVSHLEVSATIMDENYYGFYVDTVIDNTTVSCCSVSNNSDSGVWLAENAMDVTISDNSVFGNAYQGIYVSGGDRVNVSQNTATSNYGYGIHLGSVYNDGRCEISRNVASANGCGLDIYEQRNTVISWNTVDNNGVGIVISGSLCEVQNNTIRHAASYGLVVESNTSYCSFKNNTFEHDGMIVDFGFSAGNIISDNTVNGRPLVYLESVDNYTVENAGEVIGLNSRAITIRDMDLSNASVGVELWDCDDCVMDNLTTISGYCGAYLENNSSGNIIRNCTFQGGLLGISMDTGCDDNIVESTDLSYNSWYGMRIASQSNGCIIRNCTLLSNADCAVYVAACDDVRILASDLRGSDFASVWASHSSFVVDNCSLGNPTGFSTYGLISLSATYTLISGNTVEGCGHGIALRDGASDNLILNNTVSSSSYGISVDGEWSMVWRNRILNNTVEQCSVYGLYLHRGSYNTFAGNTVTGNAMGIYIDDASLNWIYLNSFSGNTVNAGSNLSVNSWHTPDPVAYWYLGVQHTGYLGNYWDDYSGTDSELDGVGDSPYTFTNAQDNYPLMTESSVYVPEFSGIALPLISLMTMLIVVCGFARSRRRTSAD